jgi:hypothetical protein
VRYLVKIEVEVEGADLPDALIPVGKALEFASDLRIGDIEVMG